MGLFRKDNPAEKKLKEIAGGLVLNNDFINELKENGLNISDGVEIKNQVKKEIKQGKVAEHDVRVRIDELIIQYFNIKNPSLKKNCPKCNTAQDLNNTFCIECGYEFENDIVCPICDLSQDASNHYCISCGYDFVDKTVQDNKKECPNCHNVQDVKNKRCSDCGYDFNTDKLPEILKKCPVCGVVQNADNLFCCNCRQDLGDVDYEPCAELIECENCNRLIPKTREVCPFCRCDFNAPEEENHENEEIQEKLSESDDIRQVRFLHTFDYNLKTCPDCNTKFLKTDPFCFNCGSSVLTQDTVKNESIEVKNGILVEKTTEVDDELSSLEALYSQTVQSRYEPDFRVAYVLYLHHMSDNPSKKFPEKLAKTYEATENRLKKQALEDGFIEPASPLIAARDFKVSDLKVILKEHNLKVSGKKDELIERLGENLSDEELKKHFKSKNYQLSSNGREFLNSNSYILYVTSDKDISKVFTPADFAKVFEEKQYSDEEIYDKLLEYLREVSDKKLTRDDWGEFKIYYNAISKVLEDKGDLKDALKVRFKVFLFDLNNYSAVLKKAEPERTRLKQKDMVRLTRLMHKMTLPVDELKQLFDAAYNETLFKTPITSQDSLIYLLKVFSGENLESISDEINAKYSNPY